MATARELVEDHVAGIVPMLIEFREKGGNGAGVDMSENDVMTNELPEESGMPPPTMGNLSFRSGWDRFAFSLHEEPMIFSGVGEGGDYDREMIQ
jgi:hypothetical protein